jgi:hypothetical protein
MTQAAFVSAFSLHVEQIDGFEFRERSSLVDSV